MQKLISAKEAASMVTNGMTVMVGGFLGCGSPETVITEVIKNGAKDLHLILNDTAFPDRGTGPLVVAKSARKVTASHIGTNPETIRQMVEEEIEVELVPQGTLAERIRSAGAGLGGVLTTTGIGTEVENAKQKVEIDGRVYLLETPLSADIALIKAKKADKMGNLVYRLTARNFNPIMALAAKTVIAEVEEIVEVGELSPDEVVTPHTFVHYLVKAGDSHDS